MDTCMFFEKQGLIIGELLSKSLDGKIYTIKNPSLVITRQQLNNEDFVLMPLLKLVEENTININIDEIPFKKLFTPKLNIANHYRKMFGSRIALVENTII